MKRNFLRASLAFVLLAGLAGCSEDPKPPEPEAKGLSGRLTVFAASSLTDVFTDLAAAFEVENPRAKVEFSFGASNALVEQAKAGAPADVIATADEESLRRLDAAVPRRTVFARNSLAIVVAKGNPLGIAGLADLARDDVTLVLCAVEVPCGKLAADVFARAGVTPSPRSLEANVKAVVSKISLREADAGVAYVTDIAGARPRVEAVTIPAEQNVVTGYPIGAVESTKNEKLAQAFISFVLSGEGQGVLTAAGFTAP